MIPTGTALFHGGKGPKRIPQGHLSKAAANPRSKEDFAEGRLTVDGFTAGLHVENGKRVRSSEISDIGEDCAGTQNSTVLHFLRWQEKDDTAKTTEAGNPRLGMPRYEPQAVHQI